MNLAGLFAHAAVTREPHVEPRMPWRLMEAQDAFGTRAGDALADFREAVAAGEATELAELVTPVPVVDWMHTRQPGLLRVDSNGYPPMQAGVDQVDEHSPLGQRLLEGQHLEARPIEGSKVIAPQDGDLGQLTVDALVPTRIPNGVGLATVSTPASLGRWDEVAAQLRDRAAELSAGEAEASPVECREALVLGPDQRWVSGCATGTCQGTCIAVNVKSEDGIDSFGCVCKLESASKAPSFTIDHTLPRSVPASPRPTS